MTDYSELVIFFLFLPVVIQILIPLLMVIGFCLLWAVRAVVGLLKAMAGVKDEVKTPKRNEVKYKLIHPWSDEVVMK